MDLYAKPISVLCGGKFILASIHSSSQSRSSQRDSNSCKTEEYPSNRCKLVSTKKKNGKMAFKGYTSSG